MTVLHSWMELKFFKHQKPIDKSFSDIPSLQHLAYLIEFKLSTQPAALCYISWGQYSSCKVATDISLWNCAQNIFDYFDTRTNILQNKIKLSECKTCYNLASLTIYFINVVQTNLGKALTSDLCITFIPKPSHERFEEVLFLVNTILVCRGILRKKD
jgi:hypothetical protein